MRLGWKLSRHRIEEMSASGHRSSHFSLLVFIFSLSYIQFIQTYDDERTVEIISKLLTNDPTCSSTLIVNSYFKDKNSQNFVEERDLGYEFVQRHRRSVILMDAENILIDNETPWNKKEPLVCQNVVVFTSSTESSSSLAAIYKQIQRKFSVDQFIIVGFQKRTKVPQYFLATMADEKLIFVLENDGHDVEILTWTADNRVHTFTVKKETDLNSLIIQQIAGNLSGRHIKVAVLNNPPSVLLNANSGIKGIEPSLLETIADHLNFTFDCVPASPNEMWGEIFGSEGNHTFTGLLGMLARKEVDVAMGNFYQSYLRWPHVSYTVVYKISYESFLVPAPQPYAKWKALFYSFTPATWIATIISGIVIAIALRLVAKWSLTGVNQTFQDLNFCLLYVVGNLLNIQMQPQNITSNPHRVFLIWWLFGTLILTTGYRSGLISYMTFPFTPEPIDTIQQLVDSPLKKVVFGTYSKSLILNASSPLQKKLGEDMIPIYNLTKMYLLLLSGDGYAVESNLDNLLYTAATMYPPSSTGPKVHLIRETILPVQAAFGLQKGSQLKPYFDHDIQRLVEAGIVDYQTKKFAKKIDNWNPKKSKDRISFSLNSLQGAFYLLAFGLIISFTVFIGENVFRPGRNQLKRSSRGT